MSEGEEERKRGEEYVREWQREGRRTIKGGRKRKRKLLEWFFAKCGELIKNINGV